MKRKSVWFKAGTDASPWSLRMGEDGFEASYTHKGYMGEIFLCKTGLYQTARRSFHIDLPEGIKKLRFVIEKTPKGEYTWFDFWDFTPVDLDVYAKHMGLFGEKVKELQNVPPRFNLWLEYKI